MLPVKFQSENTHYCCVLTYVTLASGVMAASGMLGGRRDFPPHEVEVPSPLAENGAHYRRQEVVRFFLIDITRNNVTAH